MAEQHLSPEEFKVELGKLRHAAGEISVEKSKIMQSMDVVKRQFDECKGTDWNTPSVVTFDDMQAWFTKSYNDLDALLGDIISRMWKAYHNYYEAERNNIINLKSHHRTSLYSPRKEALAPLYSPRKEALAPLYAPRKAEGGEHKGEISEGLMNLQKGADASGDGDS